MKKFKKGDVVLTKYGYGKVHSENEESMTVVVRLDNGSKAALPSFEVKKMVKE